MKDLQESIGQIRQMTTILVDAAAHDRLAKETLDVYCEMCAKQHIDTAALRQSYAALQYTKSPKGRPIALNVFTLNLKLLCKDLEIAVYQDQLLALTNKILSVVKKAEPSE